MPFTKGVHKILYFWALRHLASLLKKYIVHRDCLRERLEAVKGHPYEYKRHNYKRQ